MSSMLLSFVGGAGGAALISGVFTIVFYLIQRKHRNEDKEDVQNKALRYIMLYIIQERAKTMIAEGQVTIEDRRGLHAWHSLYHNELYGNGDADGLMAQVDKLPIKVHKPS